MVVSPRYFFICSSCLKRGRGLRPHHARTFNLTTLSPRQVQAPQHDDEGATDTNSAREFQSEQRGRLTERLEQLTEESIEQAGSRASKTIEEAGFSDELRQRLEAKIKDAQFKSDNAAAFAQVEMPSSAGRGTQMQADAQPWTGQESLSDAALRMLNDAHKPLRGLKVVRPSSSQAPAAPVDLRMKKPARRSDGQRLLTAKDRMSAYAMSQDPALSEHEREQYRKQLRDRFTAGARPMPGTVQGLQSLANERIEDAIARGQFKNIARGKGKNIEKDYNANSPFLDTTEYFMNKMIQKQDIVPPWIEKQQELVKTANVFRSRMRADWKRHAARVIASRGGSLESQVQRAEAYAAAEMASNPRASKTEAISGFDSEGRLSKLMVKEDVESTETKISVSEGLAEEAPKVEAATAAPSSPQPEAMSPSSTLSDPAPSPSASLGVFRDPDWEKAERAYHTVAISDLNNQTRSYNLQAPELAKKPYFSLERELRSCYADVARQLPGEILERARRPEKVRVEVIGHHPGGVLSKFGGKKVAVYDERKPQYGFKQFWKDLWGQRANA